MINTHTRPIHTHTQTLPHSHMHAPTGLLLVQIEKTNVYRVHSTTDTSEALVCLPPVPITRQTGEHKKNFFGIDPGPTADVSTSMPLSDGAGTKQEGLEKQGQKKGTGGRTGGKNGRKNPRNSGTPRHSTGAQGSTKRRSPQEV